MKLKEALKHELSPSELEQLVRAYDVIGDLAITIIPPELREKEHIIGETILRIHKNIKVVARRDGNYQGEFRTIPLKVIAGENRKETECREYGVRLCLNPEKVYFSVRSGTERKRLADQVQPGEEVLVMFSGVGAFPLVMARNSPSREIVGIEKNATAHEYAVRNLACNKKIRNVIFLPGDVTEVMPTLGRKFDRLAMPLPKTGENYLDLALGVLKPGGWLHFYDFQQKDHFAESVDKVASAGDRMHRTLIQSKIIVCGHSGPKTYRICVDGQVE
ncbi:class I SAM-dependent methyltransferase family protein [Thermodesulfobacteriota bacterium]